MLRTAVDFAVKEFKFDPDAFVHELVDSIIGDQYPSPDRMLVHAERVVRAYLTKEMCPGIRLTTLTSSRSKVAPPRYVASSTR